MTEVRCAAIIAGGASRRMGRNKALLEIEGEPIIARTAGVLQSLFPNLIVVTTNPEIEAACGFPAIPDAFSGRGPLGGIHAALHYFEAPVFCVACDMPFLNKGAIEFLCAQLNENFDAVLPRVGSGENHRAEPLHAVYAPACAPIIEAEFERERVRSVEGVLQAARVRYVEETSLRAFDSELRFLRNWNFPQEAQADGFTFS